MPGIVASSDRELEQETNKICQTRLRKTVKPLLMQKRTLGNYNINQLIGW